MRATAIGLILRDLVWVMDFAVVDATGVDVERMAEPVEIARVVLFMASDAASYMTGAMITVDAGFTAK